MTITNPSFSLPVSGTDPKASSREDLEGAVEAYGQDIIDQLGALAEKDQIETDDLQGDSVATGKIQDGAVVNAKLADMTEGTAKYRRPGAGTGSPTDNTLATLKTDMAFVKGDVGLGNVDNTSDANKPISTAQAAALDAKADKLIPIVPLTIGGTADALTATAPAGMTAYASNQLFLFFAAATNTSTTPTINIGGLGARTIRNESGAALVPGDIQTGWPYLVRIGASDARIIMAPATKARADMPLTGVSSSGGTANAQTASAPAWMGSYISGQVILWFPNATNTAADPTLALGTLGAATIKAADGSAIAAGDVRSSSFLLLRYVTTGNQWRIIGSGVLPSTVTSVATTAADTLRLAKDGWAWSPNIFPDPSYRLAGSTVGSGGSSGNFSNVVTKNGRRCIEVPAQTTATLWAAQWVDISGFASGKISISGVLEEKIGTQAANDSLRFRVRFWTADQTTIVPLASTVGSDNTADINSYTRYVPTADVTSPTTFVVCEDYAFPAGAAWAEVNWRVENAPASYWTNICVREGASAQFVDSTVRGAAVAVTAGTGGTYATIDDALDAIGGAGTIILKHDRAYTSTQRITPSKVLGPVTILGEPSQTTGLRPRILLADAVSGIAAVAGTSRVYRFAVSGITSTPPHVWIHDLADASTAVAIDDDHPLRNGRSTRLPSTKCKKLVAADLAAAKAAMDASDNPYVYYDGGYLYVSGVAGANLTSADIRIDASTGWINSGTALAYAPITVVGVEVMYGGANFSPFRGVTLRDFSSIGSRGNAIDYKGVSVVDGVEAAGAANWTDGITGDGLNGHTYAVLSGEGLWAHDNQDDGESNHENGRTRLRGCLFEANGGSAAAPAYGTDAVYEDCLSLGNQTVSGRKAAAFLAIGRPAQGSPVDAGRSTIAIFRRCVSKGDTVSFGDDADNATYPQVVKAICEDCTSVNATTTAFDVYEVSNCRVVGSATAKRSDTIVRSAGTVVS